MNEKEIAKKLHEIQTKIEATVIVHPFVESIEENRKKQVTIKVSFFSLWRDGNGIISIACPYCLDSVHIDELIQTAINASHLEPQLDFNFDLFCLSCKKWFTIINDAPYPPQKPHWTVIKARTIHE